MRAVAGIVLKGIVTELVVVPIVQLKVLVLLVASVAGVVLLLVLVVVLALVSQKAFVPIVAVVAGLLLVLVVVLALVSQKAFVPIVAVVPGMPINGIGMQVEQEPIILPVLLAHFTSTMLQELSPLRLTILAQLAPPGINFPGAKHFKLILTSPLRSEHRILPLQKIRLLQPGPHLQETHHSLSPEYLVNINNGGQP